MRSRRTLRRALAVSAAAAVIVFLAGTLAVRVAARGDAPGPPAPAPVPAPPPGTPVAAPGPPAAVVPPPRPVAVADLGPPPCWACSWSTYRPTEFEIDLDYLAPLGDGRGNAALWLRDFARHDGRRREESYRERMTEREIGGRTVRALPPGDPLLLEAEPWIDQARCRFYPDVWEFRGIDTAIPNLMLALDLARSWIARGLDADDPSMAAEDFRRAIRLGRLLRQDDVTIIQDLVALACIRMGAEALYEQARARSDAAGMVAASLVLADKDGMRNLAAQRVTVTERVYGKLSRRWYGGWSLDASDEDVETVADHARRVTERRFRMEAMLTLRAVLYAGTRDQRGVAEAVMTEYAASDDDLLADAARFAMDEPVTEAELASLAGFASK